MLVENDRPSRREAICLSFRVIRCRALMGFNGEDKRSIRRGCVELCALSFDSIPSFSSALQVKLKPTMLAMFHMHEGLVRGFPYSFQPFRRPASRPERLSVMDTSLLWRLQNSVATQYSTWYGRGLRQSQISWLHVKSYYMGELLQTEEVPRILSE